VQDAVTAAALDSIELRLRDISQLFNTLDPFPFREPHPKRAGALVPESLVIVGWVVLWRPVEMCLYDWLPVVRRRRLYRRLAESQVTVHYETSPAPG
jgi:hypothetical protein